jgi:uncharacterized membrane protein YoaK (UPF0700 family)
LAGPQPIGSGAHLLIFASALAMGAQSATARQPGVAAVSTTYVTGTLTSLTSGTVEWLRSPQRGRSQVAEERVAQPDTAVIHGPVLPVVAWGVNAAGALVGGLVVMTMPTVALLPTVGIVAVLALVDYRAG